MNKASQICSPSKERNLKVLLPKVCNYRCSYCFQKKVEGPYDPVYFTHEKLHIIGTIIEHFRIERITLIGGEPTMFDLFPLIHYIRNYPIKEIFITTNFTQPNDYFLNMQQAAKEAGSTLKLCCSLHDEFADYKEFVDRINDLHDRGLSHVAVEFVVAKNNKDNCCQIIDYIKNHLCEGVFFLIDCDMFDEEMKMFYEANQLSQNIKSEGLDYSVYYEDGHRELYSRQELRLQAFPSEKYCITDLVLSESNTLESCFRKLGSVDSISAIIELFHDEELFKCDQEFCRFCDSPRIYYKKYEFGEYLKSKYLYQHKSIFTV